MQIQDIASTLISAAVGAIDNSHPSNPSNLRFGAAVQSLSGVVFVSSAFWSDTLTLALHAEHAALAHASAHNDRLIAAIACVSTEDATGETFCHPCGICKQLLYENALSSGSDIRVFMANLKGAFIARWISELVSFPWPSGRELRRPNLTTTDPQPGK
jgi:cytidine deaminase